MSFTELLNTFSEFPILLALILGLLVAINPCPLAMNIGAIAFIGKDIQNKKKVFINGLLYTLGRIISFTLLGIVLIFILNSGKNIHLIQTLFSEYGEKVIGFVFLVIGIFMLDIVKFHSHNQCKTDHGIATIKNKQNLSPLALGMVLALAFCPYGASLFFGVLIPVAVESPIGYLLPVLFAISTSVPVVILAWFLAYGFSNVNKLYDRMQNFDKWIRRVVAVLLIGIGLYYIITSFGFVEHHHIH